MTTAAATWRTELRPTLVLAGPIVLAQVAHMSMGVVDTLVAGRIGTVALAGLGLAANFFWTFTHVCVGGLMALDTFFAQSVGARDERGLARYFAQSFWLCAAVTVLSAVVLFLGNWLYVSVAAPSPTREAFGIYLRNVIWCLPAIYFFFALQRYWQARQRVVAFMAFTVLANGLNLLVNLALGLGWWGFPRLEVQGLALASVASRYALLVAGIAYTAWRMRGFSLWLPRIDREVQRRFLGLGLPAAGQAASEVGVFVIATFLMGVFSTVALAAHHVCLIMAAFTFMFPMGLSAAAAVRVGTFVGAGQPARARLAGWLCIGLSMLVMAGFAAGYVVFPRTLLGWFSDDPEVLAIGAKILLVVALFQVADGTQVSATGALRGWGNTRAAMIANLIGHYPIGLVLGLVLGFGLGWGAVGVWVGLAAGLIAVAVMVLWVWRSLTAAATD